MKIAAMLLFAALPLAAQTASEDLKGVQDNSLLIEEAYNQDPGVVQHMGMLTLGEDDQWQFAFTQERPLLNSLRHQFSFSIPFDDDGLDDLSINYRYQLLGDADADLAISPRLTLIVPTGDDSETGAQVALPISFVLTPRVAAHTNVQLTWQDGSDLLLGQSLVYAVNSRVHAFVEATYDDDELIVSPAVRWAYNRPSGWQIVPAVGVPIGDQTAVVLYLSFEK